MQQKPCIQKPCIPTLHCLYSPRIRAFHSSLAQERLRCPEPGAKTYQKMVRVMAQKSTARMVAVSRRLLRLNRPRPPFLFRPPDCCLFWRRARERLRPASWLFLVVPEHCLAACSLTRHSFTRRLVRSVSFLWQH